ATRLTSQHRTDPHSLYARPLNLRRKVFIDFLVRLDDYATFNKIDDILERCTADNAVTQRLDFLAAFNNRTGGDSTQRAAVRLADDYVLRYVDQTSRQVTRVGRLECCVGQTLAGAVRRNEVLQHVQTFAEIRLNWGFNDLARRTRHQATHTGQLPNLLGATTRSGIAHDENWI